MLGETGRRLGEDEEQLAPLKEAVDTSGMEEGEALSTKAAQDYTCQEDSWAGVLLVHLRLPREQGDR